MESSQTISIESFSYSWLVNIKPSLDSLESSLRASVDESDEASFIELDPTTPPSKRFFRNSQDFKFDFPASQLSRAAVHADELFCNGYLMPLFTDPMKIEAYSPADSAQMLPTYSCAPKMNKTRCSSLGGCRRLSKRIFVKYFDFLRPLYRKLRSRRSSSRPVKVDERVHMEKNFVHSPVRSPCMSAIYASDDTRTSCDSESSIYEAVLHCKRSIEK